MNDPNSKGGRRGGGGGGIGGGGGGGGFTASQVALAGILFGVVFYLLTGGFARVAGGGRNGGDDEALVSAVENLTEQVNNLAEEQRQGLADIRAQLQRQQQQQHTDASVGGGGGGGGDKKTATATTTAALAGGGGGGGAAAGKREPGIHVVVTSNGNRYMNWQTRVLYANYKKAAAESPEGLLCGFTRVLHRTSDDELMHEVPTKRHERSSVGPIPHPLTTRFKRRPHSFCCHSHLGQ